MTLSDLKVYTLNLAAISVSHLTELESALKIVLLIVSIGYTISKWWNSKESNKDKK